MSPKQKRGSKRRRGKHSAAATAPAAGAGGAASESASPGFGAVALRAVKSVPVVVGLVATVIGLVFVLWPALKPEGPAPVKDAKLDHPEVDRRTFAQYLQQVQQSPASFTASDLRERGALVTFHYVIEGYKGKHLPLRWQLIDARSGDQVQQSNDLRLVPSAPQDSANWFVWVPVPRGHARRFYVELQLYDEAGRFPIGDHLRTRNFSGL